MNTRELYDACDIDTILADLHSKTRGAIGLMIVAVIGRPDGVSVLSRVKAECLEDCQIADMAGRLAGACTDQKSKVMESLCADATPEKIDILDREFRTSARETAEYVRRHGVSLHVTKDSTEVSNG